MASSCNRRTNPSAQPSKPAAPSKTGFKPKHQTGKRKRFSVLLWSRQRTDLAFSARVGNNLFGTVMRLACGLAIALWLSSPAVGTASQQQDPAGSPNAAGQAPAPPAPPAENAPPEKSPSQAE